MSSTNKTAHLQLDQWEPTDPFLREDLNEDLRKLDEKLGALPLETLMDVTTTQAVSTVELDLTTLDPTKYLSFKLYQMTGNNSDTIFLRLNKDTRSYTMYSTFSNNWDAFGSHCHVDGGCAELELCGNTVSISGIVRRFRPNTPLKASQLLTIDLMNDSGGSSSFPVGTRFVLTGVRA